MAKHCWGADEPVVWILPVDGADGEPRRVKVATDSRDFRVKQVCCRCGLKRIRSWKHEKNVAGHGAKHDVFDALVETTVSSDPAECSGR